MAAPSPARLYATLAGAALFVGGIVGFFFDLAWLNFLYLASGALALLLAGAAPRAIALGTGGAYTGLAIFTFSDAGWLHLTVGLLGLAAYAGSRTARSEPRTQAAGKSA